MTKTCSVHISFLYLISETSQWNTHNHKHSNVTKWMTIQNQVTKNMDRIMMGPTTDIDSQVPTFRNRLIKESSFSLRTDSPSLLTNLGLTTVHAVCRRIPCYNLSFCSKPAPSNIQQSPRKMILSHQRLIYPKYWDVLIPYHNYFGISPCQYLMMSLKLDGWQTV